MSHITQKELENYLWNAAVLLRGVIDPSEYKTIIFPLMFLKRISDVYDEEFQIALEESGGDVDYAALEEMHRFQIPDGAHWDDIRKVTSDVGQTIQSAMRAIEKANPDMLTGIFGDNNWSNKERISDGIICDLIEHFSTVSLSVENVPYDQFGNAYEYLIKQFADDSGHTAAEFYTNRTVVELMTQIVDPKAGETIYDPTCGTGGMLLNAMHRVQKTGGDYRTLGLYGQEVNLITSAIARMNMFIHGVENFEIVRGDTLAEPKLLENDKLMQFDVILANPPYSIKKWNRDAWQSDPYGRNIYGTPPQGCADYTFQQHIIASLKKESGRCAVLWPHGILFRDSEQSMRQKMIEDDIVEAVIGIGPNLFYNSPMEACVLVCNLNKPKERKGKILFINAVDQVVAETAQSYLSEANINHIVKLYKDFGNLLTQSHVATIAEIAEKNYSLNVAFYIERYDNGEVNESLESLIENIHTNSTKLKESFHELSTLFEGITHA